MRIAHNLKSNSRTLSLHFVPAHVDGPFQVDRSYNLQFTYLGQARLRFTCPSSNKLQSVTR